MKKQNIITLSHQYQMDKTQVLGKGSTGEVYLGKQLSSNQSVAIKLIRLETIDNQVTEYLLRMEKLALTTLCHENVLRGYKIIQNSTKCYMITEYCNGGTLKQLIRKQGTLNEEKSLQIVKAILKGYNSLVRKGIVHRDLKPANIMFHNGSAKIIDFGYCEIDGHQKPSLQYNVGSPSYMAPQSFQSNIYNQKTQIWAIGIILFQCLMGKTFDDGKHMSEIFKMMKKYGIPFGKDVSQKCRKIISWCLQFSPDKRPTALELINFLTQKKQQQGEPQFFILDKNRKKASSLYANNFEPINLLAKKKAPVIVEAPKMLSSTFQTFDSKQQNVQAQILRRKISIKQCPKLNFEQPVTERRTSRSNSRSTQKFGYITKNQGAFLKKTQNISANTQRQRVGSNYLVKNEYGLGNGKYPTTVFKTEKYFTGQNVGNKMTTAHISAFNSGVTSPRQMTKKPSLAGVFAVNLDRNPQSESKNGLITSSKQSISTMPTVKSINEEYFQYKPQQILNPPVARFSVHEQRTVLPNNQKIVQRQPIRKQNLPSQHPAPSYLTGSSYTTRYTSQYVPAKTLNTKQNPCVQNYQQYQTRQRPASSIYEVNKRIMEQQKQKHMALYGSLRLGQGTMGQRTCR